MRRRGRSTALRYAAGDTRLKQGPFNLAAAVSLVLCATVGLLWVDSAFRLVQAYYNHDPHPNERFAYYVAAESFSGRLKLAFARSHFTPAYFDGNDVESIERYRAGNPTGGPRWRWSAFPAEAVSVDYKRASPRFEARYDVATLWTGHRADWWRLTVPHWLAMALLLGLPAARVAAVRKGKRRRIAGRCPTCGYDLRATPDRCPECGSVPQPPHNPPMQRTGGDGILYFASRSCAGR